MIFPVIQFARSVRRQVSDIEYLATIESGNGAGNSTLKTDEGTLSATGDLASITASASKDLYLAKAIVSVRAESITTAATVIVVLKVNGVIKETYSAEIIIASGEGATTSANYHFGCVGLKVDAAQIIKLEAVTVGTNLEVNGYLQCIEIDDGISPRLP